VKCVPNESTNGERCNARSILVGKPQGKTQQSRQRYRWVHNIKMNLIEIGGCDVDWIDLVQDRDCWRAFVNTVMNRRIP
jgi:hypothetical protein